MVGAILIPDTNHIKGYMDDRDSESYLDDQIANLKYYLSRREREMISAQLTRIQTKT